MHDAIQQAAQAVATGSPIGRGLIIFCGAALVYLLGLVWLLVAVRRRATLTLATLARVAALAALAFLAAKALNHIIDDPRPFIVAHTQPLIPVEREANGFPSDHGLLAALLTLSLWWIDRRVIGAFALGMALVMLGRLGIGAHQVLAGLLGAPGRSWWPGAPAVPPRGCKNAHKMILLAKSLPGLCPHVEQGDDGASSRVQNDFANNIIRCANRTRKPTPWGA